MEADVARLASSSASIPVPQALLPLVLSTSWLHQIALDNQLRHWELVPVETFASKRVSHHYRCEGDRAFDARSQVIKLFKDQVCNLLTTQLQSCPSLI